MVPSRLPIAALLLALTACASRHSNVGAAVVPTPIDTAVLAADQASAPDPASAEVSTTDQPVVIAWGSISLDVRDDVVLVRDDSARIRDLERQFAGRVGPSAGGYRPIAASPGGRTGLRAVLDALPDEVRETARLDTVNRSVQVTSRLLVKLHPGTDPGTVIARHHLRQNGAVAGFLVLSAGDPLRACMALTDLINDPAVAVAEPDLVRRMMPRTGL